MFHLVLPRVQRPTGQTGVIVKVEDREAIIYWGTSDGVPIYEAVSASLIRGITQATEGEIAPYEIDWQQVTE